MEVVRDVALRVQLQIDEMAATEPHIHLGRAAYRRAEHLRWDKLLTCKLLVPMAFTQNVKNAAGRHFRAAQILYEQSSPGDQPGCMAVSGYLFGIAGELAVKELMRNSGMTPLPEARRRDDPFYAHFPQLKTMLATAAGRRAGELRQLAEDPRLFQNWDITMRYAPTTDVNKTWVEAWKDSAEKLIQRMAIS